MALTSALAPAAADAIGRGSGLMDLFKPLDYPRQAVANAGRSLWEMLQGRRDVAGGLLGMAPALAGAGVGALTGNPMLGLALGGGALQGALGATGMEEFQAPTPQDVAGAVGLGDSLLGTIAVNSAIDPLSFLGMPRGARPAAGPADEMARAAAAPPVNPLTPDDLQYIDVQASPGLGELPPAAGRSADELLEPMRRLHGKTLSSSVDAATFGSAEGIFDRANQNMLGVARANAPGGQYRFGTPLDPNATPSTLRDMLAQATDPRTPYVRYNERDLMTDTMFGGRGLIAPPHTIPQAPPGMYVGRLPDDMLVPRPQPSIAQLSGPDADDILAGLPPVGAPIPGEMMNWPGLSVLSPADIADLRNPLQSALSYVGREAPGGAGFQNVLDMPMDEALALIRRERLAARSALQEHMARIARLPPDELDAFRQVSDFGEGVPARRSRLFLGTQNVPLV
jgi:hypothetical protein